MGLFFILLTKKEINVVYEEIKKFKPLLHMKQLLIILILLLIGISPAISSETFSLNNNSISYFGDKPPKRDKKKAGNGAISCTARENYNFFKNPKRFKKRKRYQFNKLQKSKVLRRKKRLKAMRSKNYRTRHKKV